MYSSKRTVYICDITSVTDKETGDRKKSVENGTIVIGIKDLVGIQTQQLAQAQNMNFNYSIEIDRMFYSNQKYLYMERTLYEIKNVAKASRPQNCKLNVVALNDADIKMAVEEWINGLQ